MQDLTLLYVPCASKEEASTITDYLIEHCLVACVNSTASTTTYADKKEKKSCQEVILFIKTVPEYCQRVCDEIKRMHSYQTPCILKIDARVNTLYYQWAEKQCTG